MLAALCSATDGDDREPSGRGRLFSQRVSRVHAVLFVMPEYNRSVPGALPAQDRECGTAWLRPDDRGRQEKVRVRTSSLARLGLGVHVTAPTIHAGFDGHIRLEMVNHGKLPIRLRTGMRICQLIFEQTLGTPDKGYRGHFSGQSS